MRSSFSDMRRPQIGGGSGSGGSGGGGGGSVGGSDLMRGDDEYADLGRKPEYQHQEHQHQQHQHLHQHQQHQHQHQQLVDKWACPCGGSCSDELTRLESRLILMESRLADFEAMIKSSGRSLSVSQSGDCVSGHNWPESSRESQPQPLPQPPTSSLQRVLTFGETEAEASTGEPGGGETAAATTGASNGGGTALNLVFTEDDSRSTSSTWTDLCSKEPSAPLAMTSAAAAAPEAGKKSPLQHPLVQPKEPLTCHTTTTDSSFDVVRYSTQETFVRQQQHDLASCPSPKGGSMVGTTPPPLMRGPARQLQLLCGLRHADGSLVSTDMGRPEHLLVMPEDERSTSRSVVELGPQCEVAAPPASVGISRSCTEQRRILRGRAAEGDVPAFPALAAAAIAVVNGADAAKSSETATAECPSDLVVVRSRVTRVRSGSVPGVLGNISWGPQLRVATASGTFPAATLMCDQLKSDNDDEDCSTVSTGTGEQTTASARGLAAGHNREANKMATSSCIDCDASSRSNADNSCQCGGNENPDMSAECRLCSDIEPYTRWRLRDLGRRSGSSGGGGVCDVSDAEGFGRKRARRGAGAQGGSSTMDVCIQRSGFSQLDTVLIAGLILKAASLHDTEGDQASFVRLTLRKMGFECAVIIGRHFTGCICGLDSSRLLLDFGDKSCLIFSFFQLTSSLNQLSSVK